MTAVTPNDTQSGIHARAQQSPLASQRAKQNNQPSGNNTRAKSGPFFTLGYKDGFSQWVRIPLVYLSGSIVH